MHAYIGAVSLQADDQVRAWVDRRQRRDLHRIEYAKDVQLPFLGQVRRVGEKREGNMHGETYCRGESGIGNWECGTDHIRNASHQAPIPHFLFPISYSLAFSAMTSLTVRRRQVLATDAMLVAMALIWAVNYSVLKYGTRLMHPLAYNGVRIPAAALLQFGIAGAMRLPTVPRKDAFRLILLGMLVNGVYQVFFILGQSRSRVATTVLMLASGPALAAILGRLRGTESLSRRSWYGIALQLVGVLCVVLGSAGSTGGRDSLLGSALVFSSAVSWALFSVMVQPLTTRVHGIQVGAYTMLGGGIVSLLVSIPMLGGVDWIGLETGVWWAMAYSTIGAMVIAYLFWYHGVKTLGPTHTSMYSNMQPILAMGAAWLALGEIPSRWQVSGATFIMSGLLLARSSAHEPEGV